MSASTRNNRLFSNAIAYFLLVLGSIAFGWPLIWMVGSSLKADKEQFSQNLHLLPQQPLAESHSPYVDERFFEDVKVTREDLLDALETYVSSQKNLWPADVDNDSMKLQVARGLYERMLNLLPKEKWLLGDKELADAAISHVDSTMLHDAVLDVRRSLLIGQLRARSYDIQEDQLVASNDAASAWSIAGDAKGNLQEVSLDQQQYAELHYDFSSGDKLLLTRVCTTSFPISRLYRIQLSLRADESWHPLRVRVEKMGNLYESVRDTPMADTNWAVLSWQEPGPDDLTNKIRTWIQMKKVDSGPSYESDPHRMKITLEIESSNAVTAWYYKIVRNFIRVFDNMPFWRYTATSIVLVILNLVGTLFSCSIVGYAFARMRWPGRGLSYAMMLGTMMVPAQVTMIPFFLIVRYLNWYNTLYPLWVGSFTANAFFVFLLHQFYKGIPTDLEDAAKIDGCGPLRIYWYIMLPLIQPALASVAIFTFMGAWGDFMQPYIYLSDQRLYPLSLGLYALQVQSGSNMSIMLAGSLLMMVPVVVIFFFMQRYFIEGITMTGLKS